MYRSVRLASSLAAASLDGLFEHSVGLLTRYSLDIRHPNGRFPEGAQ